MPDHQLEDLGQQRSQSTLVEAQAAPTSAPDEVAVSNRQAQLMITTNTSRAVAICAAAFSLAFTSCGTCFSFGVYQELYQSMSLQPGTPFTGASPAWIDLIGTLSVSFMTLAAPLATGWTRRFSPRRVIYFGGGLLLIASLLASWSQRLWQFILTQGLLIGFGTCFSALALGLILSGTGIGGLVWAPLLHYLNDTVGFRWGLRVSGIVCSAMTLAGGAILDWDPVSKAKFAAEAEARRARAPALDTTTAKAAYFFKSLWQLPLIDYRTARTPAFLAQLLANALHAGAYYTPIFFFSAYAKTLGYSSKQGAEFIAINNVASSVGRIVVGLLADKFGRINLLVAVAAVSAVSALAFWLPSTVVGNSAGKGLFVTFSILNGASMSAFVSLFPATLVEMFGPHAFASINGLIYLVRGIATLIGTPTAGALVRHAMAADQPSAYFGMSVMVGALLAAATAGAVWIKLAAKSS